MSTPNQTIRSLRKESGNSNFQLAIHRALKVTANVLSLERNNKHFFLKKRFFQTSLYKLHVAQAVA